MAADAFLKIADVPGESTDSQYKDWIEVQTYSFGISQPVTRQGNGYGLTVGKAEFGDLTISKEVDKATPKLALMSSNGKEIKEMTLALCRAGGDKTKFFEVKLTGCVITGYDFEGSGDLPTENITFSYSKIGWTYILQRRSDGAGGGQVAAGWDLSANKQV